MSFFKHYVFPFVFIIGAPIVTQVLVNHGSLEGLDGFKIQMLFGNAFSWFFVIVWLVWNASFLMIPFDRYKGSAAPDGFIPEYTDNCSPLFVTTLLSYLSIHSMFPKISLSLYENFPYILGTLNIVGFVLCIYLYIDGKLKQVSHDEKVPMIYEFFRGVQLHPTILNFDVKQWATARVGIMGTQMLLVAFYIASYFVEGFNLGLLVNAGLQVIYLYKFFCWENSYLKSMDIIHDRAGFYICWGYLNWYPALYTYSTYYMISHPPQTGNLACILILAIGFYLIRTKFQIDYEKDKFKLTNGNTTIGGNRVTYIETEYRTNNGMTKARLLTSGYWGQARHLNYFFEILCSLAWSSVGYGLGSIHPFLGTIYLTILLIHRTYRDDEKCLQKYGEYWIKYKKTVKYRLIPNIF